MLPFLRNAAVAGALFAATSAHASVYLYEYQGNDLVGPYCGERPCAGFSGFIELDESLFPGGVIAGSELEITYTRFPGPGGTYSVLSPEGTFTGTYEASDLPDWVSVGGIVGFALFGIVLEDVANRWAFDSQSEIAEWSVGGGAYGGSNDFGISDRGGDFFSGGAEAPPGTWTLTVTHPAVIPLPASAVLLAGALGALGVSARRSRRTTP